jgi:hypothetical protein
MFVPTTRFWRKGSINGLKLFFGFTSIVNILGIIFVDRVEFPDVGQ